jgi:hypothetical protein
MPYEYGEILIENSSKKVLGVIFKTNGEVEEYKAFNIKTNTFSSFNSPEECKTWLEEENVLILQKCNCCPNPYYLWTRVNNPKEKYPIIGYFREGESAFFNCAPTWFATKFDAIKAAVAQGYKVKEEE